MTICAGIEGTASGSQTHAMKMQAGLPVGRREGGDLEYVNEFITPVSRSLAFCPRASEEGSTSNDRTHQHGPTVWLLKDEVRVAPREVVGIGCILRWSSHGGGGPGGDDGAVAFFMQNFVVPGPSLTKRSAFLAWRVKSSSESRPTGVRAKSCSARLHSHVEGVVAQGDEEDGGG